jgi:hypothetical protein
LEWSSREGLEQATWEQKQQLIEWLVVLVIVTDGNVEIRSAIPTNPNGEALALSFAFRLSRICSPSSRNGAGSRPATTAAPTPSSQPSASDSMDFPIMPDIS